VFGDGLLERTRSTTIGLLGLAAAVGLALVAVAVRGDWPLVAGSPVPRAPVVRESIGRATPLNGRISRAALRQVPSGAARAVAPREGPRPTPPAAGEAGGPPAATPDELVSSPATPVGHSGGGGNGSHGSPAPPAQPRSPAAPQPAAQPPGGGGATTQPASPSKPGPSPPSQPEPSPPAPVTAEAPPPESDAPPWSNGQGHAYGREDGGEHGHGHGPGGCAGD
jgi:hypothetical protein